MKNANIAIMAAGLMMLPSIGIANDFSTVARVQFVQDCIQLNAGSMNLYEATHKCSCVLDKIAEVFTQGEFEETNTGFQMKNTPGERGGMFRDDQEAMDGISLFQKTHVDAYKSCRIRR